MILSYEDIEEARKLANDLKLEGASLLSSTPMALIQKICNGIGPSWFPEVIRDAITKLHKCLKVVWMIHDLQYYEGDGTTHCFKKANDNFRENGRIVADYFYKWYDPRRYRERRSAKKFAALCHAFGGIAYKNAIKERQQEEANASVGI